MKSQYINKFVLLVTICTCCGGIIVAQSMDNTEATVIPDSFSKIIKAKGKHTDKLDLLKKYPSLLSQKSHGEQKANTSKKTVKTTAKVKIAGIWESNIGWKYHIKQDGNKFTWTVINKKQKATGSIKKDNKEIHVTWNDNGSQGSTSGLILEVNKKGQATFIEWDNGVFFHRSIKKKQG